MMINSTSPAGQLTRLAFPLRRARVILSVFKSVFNHSFDYQLSTRLSASDRTYHRIPDKYTKGSHAYDMSFQHHTVQVAQGASKQASRACT